VQVRGPVAGDGGRALIVMAARWQQDEDARCGWPRAGSALNGSSADPFRIPHVESSNS
jgi:hypothetical protein